MEQVEQIYNFSEQQITSNFNTTRPDLWLFYYFFIDSYYYLFYELLVLNNFFKFPILFIIVYVLLMFGNNFVNYIDHIRNYLQVFRHYY